MNCVKMWNDVECPKLEHQEDENWVSAPMLSRTKKGTDQSLESFRPLLDGTTNWPAVLEAFDQIGYKGYLTFEYFHPYIHFPEVLVHQTAGSLDRMLGIKG